MVERLPEIVFERGGLLFRPAGEIFGGLRDFRGAGGDRGGVAGDDAQRVFQLIGRRVEILP